MSVATQGSSLAALEPKRIAQGRRAGSEPPVTLLGALASLPGLTERSLIPLISIKPFVDRHARVHVRAERTTDFVSASDSPIPRRAALTTIVEPIGLSESEVARAIRQVKLADAIKRERTEEPPAFAAEVLRAAHQAYRVAFGNAITIHVPDDELRLIVLNHHAQNIELEQDGAGPPVIPGRRVLNALPGHHSARSAKGSDVETERTFDGRSAAPSSAACSAHVGCPFFLDHVAEATGSRARACAKASCWGLARIVIS